MFTGIIERIGTVKSIAHEPNLVILGIDAEILAQHVKLGDSVAVNGVCLTVRERKGTVLTFDLVKETLERTSLKPIKVGSRVNLELALRADGRLGGHFVTGHVDAVGTIKDIGRDQNYVAIDITLPSALHKYLVNKGSIAIDGVSLTVGHVAKESFRVHLIPFTLNATNLGDRKKGDIVNIETDILAKYVLEGKSL